MSGSDKKSGVKVRPLEPPPAGFDPKTASDDELRRFGWPRRPPANAGAGQKRVWDLITQKPLTYVPPEPRKKRGAVGPGRKPRVRPSKEHPLWNVQTSQTWSGALVTAPAGNSFQDISGDFIAPNVSASNNEDCSVLVGIGFGDWENDGGIVVQAGWGADITYERGSPVPDNYLYYAWGTNSEPNIEAIPLNANPGQVVAVTISLGGPTYGTAYFANLTIGEWTSAPIGGPSLSSATAEWMVERVTYQGALLPLADYGSLSFSASTGNAGYVQGDPGSGNSETYVDIESAGQIFGPVVMVNEDNVILTTSDFDPGSVTCTFIKSE
jgi:Peptidase A4 family